MESPDKSKSRRRGRARGVLEERWVWAGAAASLLALAAVARLDLALPEPLHRGAPPDRFIADIAREHLVNLTVIGPRVAGSYENEVAAVRVLLAAVRDIARRAAPHHNIDIDLHTASGAFSIQFFDGLNNVYRGVQSVVVRVRGASGGGAGLGPRSALLLNCHFDTVPDSPGASDDAAGCAVLLETLRALVASPRGLEHDAVFLLNGAEENIMQASHAFITQHKWAKNIRAFINLEACGAGGREVLFQAGPHDPWIMEVYAGAVPHPFASSLAQELFESGLIPADTDFRIFRDFGKLSGVDLAWSANGYVYHTALDTADKVSAACLQRTGDSVLALTRGLLSSGSLQQEVDRASRQPVFFDVVGLVVVCARAGAAASLALLTVGVVLLRIHRNATDAKKHLYISRGWWWRQVARRVAAAAGALLAGGGAAVGVALLLTAGGRPLSYYCHTLLLAPLFALPGVCGAWCVVRVLVARGGGGGGHWSGAVVVGWWEARAWADAVAVLWAVALALCAARGLRSGFLPLLWALLPSLADLAASLTVAGGGVHVHGGARAWWWALGAALPLVQTWYLAVGWLRTFVPLLGRAGTRAPPDLAAALVVAALVLAATSWLLPLVAAAASLRRTLYAGLAVSVATLLVVQCTSLVPPYSAARPQRLMVFHVRRTLHPRSDVTTPPPPPEHFFWLPELEPNIPHSLDMYVAGMRDAVRSTGEECVRYPYCGAAYYLPVLSLVPHAHALTAPRPPRTTLAATLALAPAPTLGTERLLTVDLTGPSHVVVVVAVAEGAALSWVDVLGGAPLEGPLWEGRRTYFFTLHDARGQADKTWHIEMRIQHSFSSEPAQWAWVSVAGHSLSGDHQLSPDHAALKRELPLWAHATGWGVDLHLFDI